MANDEIDEFRINVVYLKERLGNKGAMGPPLQGGGGRGTFDGMEARVARLEADVAHIKDDISEMRTVIRTAGTDIAALRVDAATLNEIVRHLPTKAYIGTFVTVGVGAVITALTLFSRLGWLVAGPPTH